MNRFFIQTRGTAMGSRFAPSFANLCVGLFEKAFIMSEHQWKDNIKLYRCYIDDLGFIWEGNEAEFLLFNNILNDNDWGLNFSGSVNSIDITLFNEGPKVFTKNFFKKVDSNYFLEFNSCHHCNWVKNIPFGQLRRIKRNCTRQKDFKEQSKTLIQKCKDKKYPKTIIKEAYNRAVLTQDQCIPPRTKNNRETDTKDFKQAFITNYSEDHNFIRQIMTKYWYILKKDPFLEKTLSNKPCIIYRRAKSLKNVLAPSQIKLGNKNNEMVHTMNSIACGSFKCKHIKCKCCLNITNDVSRIQSNSNKKIFSIKDHLDCGSINVIYVISCKCGLQYVGKTSQTLRMCMNNHRHNIRYSVSRHAAVRHACKIEDFTITPVEQIHKNNRSIAKTLSQREMFWIYQLNTLTPYGLN